MPAPYRRLSHRVVSDHRIFQLAEEVFERPDGSPSHAYSVLLSVDWVNVVPVTPEGRVVLIRQFRAGSAEVTIEVPGGMVDAEDPDPSFSARRELEEETGYTVESVVRTGILRPNPAFLRNRCHMFLALGARPDGTVHLDETEDVEPFEATWAEVATMMADGRIDHSLVLNTLSFARRALDAVERPRPVIAVVGDAHCVTGSPEERHALALGKALVDAGYTLVCGGRGGVMEAACRGARQSARWRPGSVVAVLPGHDDADANPFVDVPLPTGLDAARNAVVAHAAAVVAIGGGAGTLSELALAWQLKRLVLAFRVGGWSGRLADQRLDDRVRYPGIPDDRVYGVDDAGEAVRRVAELLPRYDRTGVGITAEGR
jgi:uncharacterized protein (TIGR00725 family)